MGDAPTAPDAAVEAFEFFALERGKGAPLPPLPTSSDMSDFLQEDASVSLADHAEVLHLHHSTLIALCQTLAEEWENLTLIQRRPFESKVPPLELL